MRNMTEDVCIYEWLCVFDVEVSYLKGKMRCKRDGNVHDVEEVAIWVVDRNT